MPIKVLELYLKVSVDWLLTYRVSKEVLDFEFYLFSEYFARVVQRTRQKLFHLHNSLVRVYRAYRIIFSFLYCDETTVIIYVVL